MLKSLNKYSFLYKLRRSILQRKELGNRYDEWINSGRPLPPPPFVKHRVIRNYARQFRVLVFIETGTYLGDTVDAVKNHFEKLYSIELSGELYRKAKSRFADYDKITILHGDSTMVLPELLTIITKPCLFWLDGHYSEGITAKGGKETPVIEELSSILNHHVGGHVILIDDARYFTGIDDYPTIQEVQDLVKSRRHDCTMEIYDDIIRIKV